MGFFFKCSYCILRPASHALERRLATESFRKRHSSDARSCFLVQVSRWIRVENLSRCTDAVPRTVIYGQVDRTKTLEPVKLNPIGKFKLRPFRETDMHAIEWLPRNDFCIFISRSSPLSRFTLVDYDHWRWTTVRLWWAILPVRARNRSGFQRQPRQWLYDIDEPNDKTHQTW